MSKEKLKNYRKNLTELGQVEKDIVKLQEKLDAVDGVAGKVVASSRDFPYIEEHITVQMPESRKSAKIRKRIRKKEGRRNELLAEIEEAERFIDEMPEGIEKRIFERYYLDGETQCDIADSVGYTQPRISQILQKDL